MLLHYDIGFFSLRLNLLHRADFQSEVGTSVAFVFDLVDFSEVAITQLLYHFEIFPLHRLFVRIFNQGCHFGHRKLPFADFLVLGPV